jgi:hypothetical protein
MINCENSEWACLVWENGLCWLLTECDDREHCNYLGAVGSVDEVKSFCASHGIEFRMTRKDGTAFRPPLPIRPQF